VEEAGLIFCIGTGLGIDLEYNGYTCWLHLEHDHWHRVLVIDGKPVIEWDEVVPFNEKF
jgi:hypothetical protein